MEELLEMRQLMEAGRYPEALTLLGELEEMARDDKVTKVESFLSVLLLHLIKQAAEQRTTHSWEVSIKNALDAILLSNKRRKAGGYYLDAADLREAMEEIYPTALRRATLEAFEGKLNEQELSDKVNQEALFQQASSLLAQRFDWV